MFCTGKIPGKSSSDLTDRSVTFKSYCNITKFPRTEDDGRIPVRQTSSTKLIKFANLCSDNLPEDG